MDLVNGKWEICNYVGQELSEFVQVGNYNYETFGKVIESALSRIVKQYFMDRHSMDEGDFKEARNKNDFPDLLISSEGIAIEFKSGRNNQGPDNEMGTLNSAMEKVEDFGDEIYCLFIGYSYDNEGVYIDEVYFDKMYTFLKLNEDGILKYREKDGNLRPKSWNEFRQGIVYIEDLEEFKESVERTDKYRARRLVEKHMRNLGEEDKREIGRKFFGLR